MTLASGTRALLHRVLSFNASYIGRCALLSQPSRTCSTSSDDDEPGYCPECGLELNEHCQGYSREEYEADLLARLNLGNTILRGGHSLTHVDRSGRAIMVDVGTKMATARVATASGRVLLGQEAFALVVNNKMAKGDVLPTAELAGIMGAKQTSALIPLCHNILLSKVDVSLTLEPESSSVRIDSEARTTGVTGVEMEALTAVSVAALTVYDMCKAVSTDICISDVRLESKQGGRRNFTRTEVV